MMYNCRKILFFFLVFVPLFSFSQNNAEEDWDFIRYLIGNDMKKEVKTWAERDFSSEDYSPLSFDSINFLRAWAFYSNRFLSDAALLFDRVGDKSGLKPASLFFSSLSNAYLGKYDLAFQNLENNRQLLDRHKELYSLEQAGYALLKRDFSLYEAYKKNFTYSSYILSDREKDLDSLCFSLKNYKRKSPVLAAALSALVPGLGKVYSGKIGEGFSSFIFVGSFAILTTENWIRHGLGNWKTVLFGSIGTLFHIGNIYGSYFSVKLAYDEFNEKQNLGILYSIHIPLRNTFGL